MRCDEVQEYVSSMVDGETVPPEAAEHTAHCADCRELLQSYADGGAALRSYSSFLVAKPIPDPTWLKTKRNKSMWWEKGLQMMRVPRIAFACLVLLLVVLASRLALVEVRAHEDGSVLLLKLTPAEGDSINCDISTSDMDRNSCGGLAQTDKHNLLFSVKALKRDGVRVLLSIRSRVTPLGPASYGLDTPGTLPETQSWFTPGETLAMPGTGEWRLAMTGVWADHIPVTLGSNQLLDPGPNEIRLTSPLLLKNTRVAGDFPDAGADADKPGEGVFLFIPGEGRFLLSSAPMTGAVPATVQLNRVSFDSGGQAYVIVTGMPVSRAAKIWVLHDAAYKPSAELMQNAYLGSGPVSKLQ